jgi:pyruvate dehydrogenase E2 component (dihydrolipoamide acetyltransferase)
MRFGAAPDAGAKEPAPGAASDPAPAIPANVSVAPADPTPPAPRADGSRIIASPLARRIAKQNGIDLAAVSGSGPRGRIIKADVDAAIAGGTGKAATAESSASAPSQATVPRRPKGMSDDAVLKLFEEGSYELVRTMACARRLPHA